MKKANIPQVSIIIPVYNSGEYLERCIQSSLRQTLSNIEIICIDDGSTDNSWNVIQKFASKDKRIVTFQQKNSGAAVARNKGLELANGEYIGFIDSDDFVDEDYFERLYKTARQTKADIAVAYVKSEFVGDDIRHFKQFKPEDYDKNYNLYIKKATLSNKLNFRSVIWIAIYKKDMIDLNNISFKPELRTGQDDNFLLRASYFANTIKYTTKKTYYHRIVRDGSLMTAYNYTANGLLSRAKVIAENIAFLNSVPDYDKAIYVTRIAEGIQFFYTRLIETKSVSKHMMQKIEDAIKSAWMEAKYKQETIEYLEGMVASEFLEFLNNPKKLKKVVTHIGSSGVKQQKMLKYKGFIMIVKKVIKALVPYGVIMLWRRHKLRKSVARLNYCPICEQCNEFLPTANGLGVVRHRARCANCGALERHRLTWLFIDKIVGFEALKNKSMLHVAAEPVFERKLRSIVGKKYITADYILEADVKMDITDIKYKDNSFDIIMCNHVLEHVSDDVKAMREMRRVLKPNGWAIFLVPLADMDVTYENSQVTTDEGRLEHFGQVDHVRKYGRDYIDRLKSAGWKVEVYKAKDLVNNKEIKNMELVEDAEKWGFTATEIFYCTK